MPGLTAWRAALVAQLLAVREPPLRLERAACSSAAVLVGAAPPLPILQAAASTQPGFAPRLQAGLPGRTLGPQDLKSGCRQLFPADQAAARRTLQQVVRVAMADAAVAVAAVALVLRRVRAVAAAMALF
jgi:hypothetical protein